MNGPTNHQSSEDTVKGMYKLKKAFEIPDDIAVVKCMYKVKPLPSGIGSSSSANPRDGFAASLSNGQEHVANSTVSVKGQSRKAASSPEIKMGKNKASETSAISSEASSLESDNAVKSLEERQLEIIKKLEKLRDVIIAIHSSSIMSLGVGPCEPCPLPNFSDVVINADPRSPPYSVIFFKSMFSKFCGYNVSITTHLHSSYKKNLPPNLDIFNSPANDKTAFNITLIWRNLDHNCELMMSPIHQTPIRGEANVCRFFSRLLPQNCPLNYDTLDLESLVRVEDLIDCTIKGTFTLDFLEENLRQAQPYVLGEMSLADLLYFSEATTLLLRSQKGINSYPNIAAWIKNCQSMSDLNVFKL